MSHRSLRAVSIFGKSQESFLRPSIARSSGESPSSQTDELREALFDKAGEFQPDSPQHKPLVDKFQYALGGSIAATLLSLLLAALAWNLTAWWSPASTSHPTAILVLVACLAGSQTFVFKWLLSETENSFKTRVWDMATSLLQKGPDTGCHSESARWMNDILDSIWSFLNPDIFRSLTDIMEHIILENAPPVVKAVGTRKIGQGDLPIRILGVRRLPKQGVEDSNSEPTAGEPYESIIEAFNGSPATREHLRKKLQGLRERTSVHMEFSFDYGVDWEEQGRRKPNHIHVLLVFHLVGGFRMPVWVSIEKIVGVLRARVQLKPDPPFVTKAVCSLMGSPEVKFSCHPLFKQNMNVMGMPLVSSLVKQALDAALAAYIAPRSVTIDLEALLSADYTSFEAYALGSIVVKIHKAYDVAEEHGGHHLSSFVRVGMAKMGDPLYVYRTVEHRASPRWEETMVYEVGSVEINAQEHLKLELCRAGASEGSDCIGYTQQPLADLIADFDCAGKMQRRTALLVSDDDDEKTEATLEYSIGFFPKVKPTPDQLKQQTIYPNISTSEDLDHHIEKQTRHKFREAPSSTTQEEFIREKSAAIHDAERSILNSIPPSENYPSGVLQVELPIINFLSVYHAERESPENQSEEIIFDDDVDEFADRPDSYANIYINGKRVTKTLTKPKDSDPAYGSYVWKFVRDWRTAEIVISVRNHRFSRADPLIGACRIPVGPLMRRHGAARVRQSFPLEGGMGGGLADVVVLWRSIDKPEPSRSLISWETGTMDLMLPIVDIDGSLGRLLGKGDVIVRTDLARKKIYPKSGDDDADKRLYWALKKDDQHHRSSSQDSIGTHKSHQHHKHRFFHRRHADKITPPSSSSSSFLTSLPKMSFPLKNKFSDRLILTWEPPALNRTFTHDKLLAYAFLPLAILPENEVMEYRVPVYECGKHVKEVDDNELWFEDDVHEDVDGTDRLHGGKKPVGYVGVTLGFTRGVGKEHAMALRGNKDVEDLVEVQRGLGERLGQEPEDDGESQEGSSEELGRVHTVDQEKKERIRVMEKEIEEERIRVGWK